MPIRSFFVHESIWPFTFCLVAVNSCTSKCQWKSEKARKCHSWTSVEITSELFVLLRISIVLQFLLLLLLLLFVSLWNCLVFPSLAPAHLRRLSNNTKRVGNIINYSSYWLNCFQVSFLLEHNQSNLCVPCIENATFFKVHFV